MDFKFKIGDRVMKVNDAGSDGLRVGDIGTICYVPKDSESDIVGVCGDRYTGGHTCLETCENGYGWWVEPENLVLVAADEDDNTSVDMDSLL